MEESECPDKPQNLNIGEPNLRSDFLRQRQDSVPSLTLTEKFCYGVGHVFNDLCASMWFSYLLLFFEKVLLFPDTLAGVVLLVGQLADGISTPIVGVLSDMENKIPACARYGRRKIWHLVGTVCVTISFPFIFSPAYGLEDASLTAQSIYYCCFVIVFQFGWASVQISHLALIPDLTPKKSLRTELNSIRYAFTVLANLSVFTITFFILGSGSTSDGDSSMSTPAMDSIWKTSSTSVPDSAISINGSCSASDTSLEPSDLNNFRTIALVCVVLGLIFSAIFHVGVKEPEFQCPKKREGSGSRMRKIDWFKQFPFYLVAVLYMATRLYVNLYQGTFATGCVIGLLGCTWTYAAGPEYADYFKVWGIFVVAVLLGSGGSTLLITSLSITADLIGNNTEGGAFVYGLMSLVDKFSNGIIIMIIQDSNTGDPMYYRDVIFYACGGACVVGLITTIALIPIKVHRRRGVAKSVISLMDGNADDSSDSGSDSSITLPSKKQLSGEVNEAADIVDTICGSLEKEAPIKHPRAIV
ncbi:hypothetical protein HAZT_HAZT001865 [Hyalella azteca]|uniref:Major facilitator superfamily associated domain-containing protein n=1 Tax=Hyalella azteca TaxID=294128 RepID=A0A6A0HCK4_HYAAZ|nr:hypothetical protein HAZT_HAZT001865 [Hyalella azteca]